jgi:hypothetical protein
MWRIFRWLDRHEPGFYKFTIMFAGFAAVISVAALLFLVHIAAGLVFGFGSVFALMRASYTYRFEKKPKPPSQRDLPISEASDGEILRRVRRHEGTEKLRRHILWLAANEPGKRGDRARGIVAMWKEAEARKKEDAS